MKTPHSIVIPADVPAEAQKTYCNNYDAITHKTGRLFLFAADQKIEHLNNDFYGSGIAQEAQKPEHIFTIAQQAPIGALALHPGLLVRNASQYNNINYIVKLNAKTYLSSMHDDPQSAPLETVDDIVCLAQSSGLPICGIGATIYIGSSHEASMLEFASKTFLHAHKHGLVCIAWAYPRGKSISDESDPQLIAGAAGLAHALGADFVKIHPPHDTQNLTSAQGLAIAVAAAGNTKIICSGGTEVEPTILLQRISEQLQVGTSGCAIGRNLFQRSTKHAIALAQAISTLVYENQTLDYVLKKWNQLDLT